MRITIAIVLCLCPIALAQVDWGGAEYLGGGSIFLYPEPCFAPDSGAIILSDFGIETSDMRIFICHDQGATEPLLPESLSVPGYNDITPDMSYDGKRVYFSSNRPGGYGGYDIWISEASSEAWSIPVNLGSPINSVDDDLSPSLTSGEDEIYFTRGNFEFWSGPFGHVLKSAFVDGQWQTPELLPSPIYSEFEDGSPSISSDGAALYFISKRPNGIVRFDYGAWASLKENNVWSEPILLRGFINDYILQQCDCILDSVGVPTSCTVDSTGSKLLYTKIDWYEADSICFDLETNLYLSYKVDGISEPSVPAYFRLALYPNPFNSSLHISVRIASEGRLHIYDITGRAMRSYDISPTHDEIIWDGKTDKGNACPSGVYFVKLQGFPTTQKAVLLK